MAPTPSHTHIVPSHFMQDLQSGGAGIVVATGHSLFFKKFVKRYASESSGGCNLAKNHKLYNGAVLAMHVHFTESGDPEVRDCRLVFGNLGGIQHERGMTCQDFNANAEKDTIKRPVVKGDILLFAVRHGTSTWNEASSGKWNKADTMTWVGELKKFDSPLTASGLQDAMALHRALSRHSKEDSIGESVESSDD